MFYYFKCKFDPHGKEYTYETSMQVYKQLKTGKLYILYTENGYNYRGSFVEVTRKIDSPIELRINPENDQLSSYCDPSWGIKLKKIVRVQSDNDISDKNTCDLITDEKENNMNIFGQAFNFGKYTKGDIKFSLKGMAYRTNTGNFVVYNKEEDNLIDVSDFVMDMDGLLYVMPVAIKDIAAGDIICHNKEFVIVKEVNKEGIKVISPSNKEIRTIMPEHNIFGFDYCSKIVSPMNGNMFNSASKDAPFGNMLPFIMLSNNRDEKSSGIEKLILMNIISGNNSFDFSNPMTMLLFCNSENGDKNDLLPLMMMSNMMNKNTEKE